MNEPAPQYSQIPPRKLDGSFTETDDVTLGDTSYHGFLTGSDRKEESTPGVVFTSNKEFLLFLIGNTIHWVAGGIAFMLAGITIVRFAILPRIHTCAPGATCPYSFDPRGEVLRLVQTLMLYWLQIGCLITGISLVKLMGYLAWLNMKINGNSIGILELKLGAIHGRALKAGLLIWRGRDFAVALLALSQFAIVTLVPLVVSHSISDLTFFGPVKGTFTYPENFTIPSVQFGIGLLRNLSVTMDAWLLGDDQTYPFDKFHGTFVFRDNRTLYALDAQPTGSRITGNIFCNAENISSVVIPPDNSHPDTWYNVTYGNQWWTTDSSTAFAFLELRPQVSDDRSSVFLPLLWSSSIPGVLQNTTRTPDGHVEATRCIHTIDLSPIEAESHDLIQPSRFVQHPGSDIDVTPDCTGASNDLCLRIYMGYMVLAGWGAVNARLSDASGQLIGSMAYCLRGALAGGLGRADPTCVVNSTTWARNLAIVAEAVMDISVKEGTAEQELRVLADSISQRQWWLQTVIPASTFILYVASIARIFYLNRKRDALRVLSLLEIVKDGRPEQDAPDYQDSIHELKARSKYAQDSSYQKNSGDQSYRVRPQYQPENTLPSQNRAPLKLTIRKDIVLYLLKTTGPWILVGLAFMFAGIAAVYLAFLPRIYICPPGAICRGLFDPQGPVLRIIQTVMFYWLEIGCFFIHLGLLKLAAYQGWFIARRRTSIESLENIHGTINGSTFQALLLLPSRSHRSLAVPVLLFAALSSLVALVVDRSISNLETTGRIKVEFSYPKYFLLPGVTLPGVFLMPPQLDIETLILDGYDKWLLGDNYTHPYDKFSNTFVVRDNRTTFALDIQPSGSRVSGTVSCNSTNITSVILPSSPGDTETSYNITYNHRWFIQSSSTFLASSFMTYPSPRTSSENHSVAAFDMLWISNERGVISNGATTQDGKMHIAICTHTIEMMPIPDQHLDYILPTKIFFSPVARNGSVPECTSGAQDDLCTVLLLGKYLLGLWGDPLLASLPPNQMNVQRRFCQRDALSYFGDPHKKLCHVDTTSWTVTLAALTGGLLGTSQLSGQASQELWVGKQSISRSRWWLQAIIPCAMLMLYAGCVGYLSCRQEAPKELRLSEIVVAAAADLEDENEDGGDRESGRLVGNMRSGSGGLSE